MRQVETKPSFFENKVCSASSSTRNLYQEYDIFKTASEWGSGEWGQGKLKCYHALSWRFIWFFSWWSICLVAIKPWPVPRVLIKLILIVLANLFTVFIRGEALGVTYSTIFSDIIQRLGFGKGNKQSPDFSVSPPQRFISCSWFMFMCICLASASCRFLP